jgi:hypothetical protein
MSTGPPTPMIPSTLPRLRHASEVTKNAVEQRDGIPVGDRIFRKPYFDPQGRMTIQQWNTASQGVDYRLGPRETKLETFTFTIPDDATDLTVSTEKIELNSQHSLRTNIRLILEETYDIEAEENRITAGFIAAF